MAALIPATPFKDRPFTLMADVGFPTGAGIRAGYSPLPELGVELHASTVLYFQTYGADVVYRPLAGSFQVSPVIRAGVSLVQSNWYLQGSGALVQPAFDASAGLEWRHKSGFSLSAGVGVNVGPLTPFGSSVLPQANLGIGYSFPAL